MPGVAFTDTNSKVPSVDSNMSVNVLTALFEMPQLDLLQPALPSFDSDWSEFLNFEHDSSLFQSSPLLPLSSTSTPPLIDDATLSPPSLPDSGLPSPDSSNVPLHPSEKSIQFSAIAEPIIHGQDFLLSPGDDVGMLSLGALLSVH